MDIGIEELKQIKSSLFYGGPVIKISSWNQKRYPSTCQDWAGQ